MSSIKNGKNLRVYVDGVAVANETEATISFSSDTRDASNKDTAGWKCTLNGLKSASISVSALCPTTPTATGMDDLWTAFDGQTPVTLRWTDNVSGTMQFTGDFIITSLEENSSNEENVSLSATFESAGAVTRIANP